MSTPAVADTSDFAALLKKTSTTPKQTKNIIEEWPADKPLDPAAVQWTQMALDNPGERVLIECNNLELSNALHSAIRAAVKAAVPDKEMHTRHQYNKDTKAMEKFGFSIGEKRGANK